MSTVHADNAQALERRFGIRLDADGDERVRVRSPLAPGAHVAVELDAGDGRWLRLLSARDPMAEAARWADETVLDGQPETVVLIGGGLGYIVDVIERRGSPARVVVVEPHAGLARLLLERRDWRPLIEAGRLALMTGPGYGGTSAVAQQVEGVDTAPVHVHPALARIWPEAVRDARAAVERLQFEAASNRHARRTLAGRYLRHTLANAARVTREGDAAALEGLFTGTPAVIAAAGPSLDRNINDLHLVRDRALVVACDTAVRPLLSIGIEPQLAVAVDPSVANACHLGALHEPRRTWLAAEASLHPAAFAHFEGRTFFFRIGDHAPWPWLQAAGVDRLHLNVWGSVVTAALDLVLRMGCDPVIFVGADLAFTDNRPYCRGTTLEAQWASWVAGGDTYERAFALLMDRWPRTDEIDVHGLPARTAGHLVSFRDWMRTRAAGAAPVRVVNATGAGILHGAAIHPASAATTLASHPTLDPDAVQARLAAVHRPAPGPATLFERIDELARREWRLPDDWTMPDPAGDVQALRAALDGPEYAVWQLARRAMATAQSPSRPSTLTPSTDLP
ncbi:MAG: DUF115 domain-containing protein [Acidobacteria bacterium]|nr:DUF115 domain-containing protein [Acidobacteriota bacterium]